MKKAGKKCANSKKIRNFAYIKKKEELMEGIVPRWVERLKDFEKVLD